MSASASRLCRKHFPPCNHRHRGRHQSQGACPALDPLRHRPTRDGRRCRRTDITPGSEAPGQQARGVLSGYPAPEDSAKSARPDSTPTTSSSCAWRHSKRSRPRPGPARQEAARREGALGDLFGRPFEPTKQALARRRPRSGHSGERRCWLLYRTLAKPPTGRAMRPFPVRSAGSGVSPTLPLPFSTTLSIDRLWLRRSRFGHSICEILSNSLNSL
jgi:hypothetical protein